MIATVVVGVVGIVGVIVGVMLVLRFHGVQAREWADERRELVNRVQAPDRIPVVSQEPFVVPEFGPDDSNLVGTIAEPKEEDE